MGILSAIYSPNVVFFCTGRELWIVLIAVIGDDSNDIPCMMAVKKSGVLGGCPSNAKEGPTLSVSNVAVMGLSENLLRGLLRIIEFIIANLKWLSNIL